MRKCRLSGISSSFPLLSQGQGQIIHALLTRAPLNLRASSQIPLDLHVLGTPPAFNLSQNQTLQLNKTFESDHDSWSNLTESRHSRLTICLSKNPSPETKLTKRRNVLMLQKLHNSQLLFVKKIHLRKKPLLTAPIPLSGGDCLVEEAFYFVALLKSTVFRKKEKIKTNTIKNLKISRDARKTLALIR